LYFRVRPASILIGPPGNGRTSLAPVLREAESDPLGNLRVGRHGRGVVSGWCGEEFNIGRHSPPPPLRFCHVSIKNSASVLAAWAAATEGVTIFHNESLEQRVKDAREKLGVITRRVDEFELQVQALARRPMSREELANFFLTLVTDRAADTQKRMLAAFVANLDHPTNTLPGVCGTAWAAYNAASLWADHQSVVRGQSEVQKADSRLHSVWFGAAAEFKARAFDAAVALAV
jgi:hypothetical protein